MTNYEEERSEIMYRLKSIDNRLSKQDEWFVKISADVAGMKSVSALLGGLASIVISVASHFLWPTK